jgi:hypothetical protein
VAPKITTRKKENSKVRTSKLKWKEAILSWKMKIPSPKKQNQVKILKSEVKF